MPHMSDLSFHFPATRDMEGFIGSLGVSLPLDEHDIDEDDEWS